MYKLQVDSNVSEEIEWSNQIHRRNTKLKQPLEYFTREYNNI